MIRNISQFLELVSVLLCFSEAFGRKKKVNIYTIIFLVAEMALFTCVNEYGFPIDFLFLTHIGLFLYCLISYGASIKVALINYFLAIVTVGVMQLLFCIPVFKLFGDQNIQSMWDELLINAMCVCTMMLWGNKIRLKEISEFFQKINRLLAGIAIFIMIFWGKRIWQIRVNKFINAEDGIQIICFLFFFFVLINEWQKAIMDAERKRTQLEMSQLYGTAYEELITMIRERQHDMKNHINAIYSMIYTIDNYDDLVNSQKEYCQYMMRKNEQTKILLSLENPLIAGFLYSKIQEAEKCGIGVEYKVRFRNIDGQISEYEIVEMIGILFDNAIEALKDIAEERKKIVFEINNNEQKIEISVANSSRAIDVEEIPNFFQPNYSSKGKGRGIGLTKLKKKVQQYAGDLIVSNERNGGTDFLQFSIILPMDHQMETMGHQKKSKNEVLNIL